MAGKRLGVLAIACLAAAASWPGTATGTTVEGEHDLTAAGVHFTLHFPLVIEHTISTSSPTPEVYGRIYVAGVTETPGRESEFRAQAGYGPDGSDPAVTSWSWAEMTANPAYGPGSPGYANDYEFSGTMLPDSVGSLDYTTRWSGDGGATWHYTDSSGQGNGVNASDFGQMTVNPSEDLESPGSPELAVGSIGPGSVSLSWSEPPDGDVVGYELFRDGVRLVRLTGTGHTDTDLDTGRGYVYTVRAYDSSFNRSAPSNEVSVTPAHPPAAVPTVRVANPTARNHTRLPFRVSWESASAASYEVQWASYSSTPDGWQLGPWQPLTEAATVATSAVFGAAGVPVVPAQGQTYAFRANAANPSGAPTEWSPLAWASVPLDDRARAISWSSGWRKATRSDRFLDTVRSSGRKGARATLQAQARGFTVIGDRCPACGKLRILERTGNGRWAVVGTVDTRAPSGKVRQVLYAGNVDRKVTRRSLRVEVVGTRGRPTVVLDAIAVRR